MAAAAVLPPPSSLERDVICVSLGSSSRIIPVQRDLHSLVDELQQTFGGSSLPQHWKLQYIIDVCDNSEYFQFLNKGIRTMQVVPIVSDITEPEAVCVPSSSSAPVPTHPVVTPRNAAPTQQTQSPAQQTPNPPKPIASPHNAGEGAVRTPVPSASVSGAATQVTPVKSSRLSKIENTNTSASTPTPPPVRPQSATHSPGSQRRPIRPTTVPAVPTPRATPRENEIRTSSTPSLPSPRRATEPLPSAQEVVSVRAGAVSVDPYRTRRNSDEADDQCAYINGHHSDEEEILSDTEIVDGAVEGDDALALRRRRAQKILDGARPRGIWRRTPSLPEAPPTPEPDLTDMEHRALAIAVDTTIKTEKKLRRKDREIFKTARDAVVLEDIENVAAELVQQEATLPPRPKEFILPRPPINTYEACAVLGVETAALAVTSPPLLKTPRYRAPNSPVPHIPPALQKQLDKSRSLFPYVTQQHFQPRAPSEGGMRVLQGGKRVPYADILKEQQAELADLQISKYRYDNMMEEYSRIAQTMFNEARELVENGTWLPLDAEAKMKRQIAELAGIKITPDEELEAEAIAAAEAAALEAAPVEAA